MHIYYWFALILYICSPTSIYICSFVFFPERVVSSSSSSSSTSSQVVTPTAAPKETNAVEEKKQQPLEDTDMRKGVSAVFTKLMAHLKPLSGLLHYRNYNIAFVTASPSCLLSYHTLSHIYFPSYHTLVSHLLPFIFLCCNFLLGLPCFILPHCVYVWSFYFRHMNLMHD